VPPGAKLTVNNKATRSSSTTRKFVSPPLQPGKDFYYTLKAEFRRDGQPVTVTKRIAVRAGQETLIELGSPSVEGTVTRARQAD